MTPESALLQLLNVEQNQHLRVLVHFHKFFMHILCAGVRWDVHTHSLFAVNSLFINSPACKSCSSSRSVSAHSENKLSGRRGDGCLLVVYKLSKRRSLKMTACFKMEKPALQMSCYKSIFEIKKKPAVCLLKLWEPVWEQQPLVFEKIISFNELAACLVSR